MQAAMVRDRKNDKGKTISIIKRSQLCRLQEQVGRITSGWIAGSGRIIPNMTTRLLIQIVGCNRVDTKGIVRRRTSRHMHAKLVVALRSVVKGIKQSVTHRGCGVPEQFSTCRRRFSVVVCIVCYRV